MLNPGRTFGRYELLLPVGKGGQAEVWAARLRGTRGFQKLVAIKTIRMDAPEVPGMEHMLLDEAHIAAAIRHPNVVETLELGEEAGLLYLVMEWVDGEPLNVILELAANRGGVPLGVGVNLVAQLCRGLHAAHELVDDEGRQLGLVHRDVSPQNVLVTPEGRAKLVDFGIAKATLRQAATTRPGLVKGKLAYMAPEQISGAPVDRRADLFTLGILLYSLTTGRHPFKARHALETARRTAEEPAAPPSQLCPGYPPALEAVVLRALEKDPARRPATALAMLQALEKAVPGALDVAAEAELASWFGDVLRERLQQRRAMLRSAQEVLDRTTQHALDVPSSPSVGSLRAVSVSSRNAADAAEPSEAETRSYDRSTPTDTAADRRAERRSTAQVELPTFRPRYRHLSTLVIAAAAAVSAGVAATWWWPDALPRAERWASELSGSTVTPERRAFAAPPATATATATARPPVVSAQPQHATTTVPTSAGTSPPPAAEPAAAAPGPSAARAPTRSPAAAPRRHGRPPAKSSAPPAAASKPPASPAESAPSPANSAPASPAAPPAVPNAAPPADDAPASMFGI